MVSFFWRPGGEEVKQAREYDSIPNEVNAIWTNNFIVSSHSF